MALDAVLNSDNSYDVGSFDAKTYFAELLRMVQGGSVINITKNGKRVAVLETPEHKTFSKAQLAHKRIVSRAHKNEEFSIAEILEAKDAGRKY